MAGLENDIIEDLLTNKHRKERKDLQAKIQNLKKTASKGDKKKRKEVLEEIAKLEIDLDKRQAAETNHLNDAKTIIENNDEQSNIVDLIDENVTHKEQAQRISKAQKRRDKKAREEKEKEAEIRAQEEINKNGPRMLEMKTFKNILKERDLCLHSISSDGDCLYNAVRHQLEITKRHPVYDVSYLRNETANYILNHKDSLIFYMTNNETGDLLSDEDFIKYCNSTRNTSAWGGHVEIKALSSILKVPIEVLQSTGPPTLQGADEFEGLPLVITYHRHMYSLGEHYNSTKPITDNDNENKEPITEEINEDES